MKTRPILFSGAMVRALLEGRKTQTRRIVKPQTAIITDDMARGFGIRPPEVENTPSIACPYGKPGDLLWIRETHAYQWPENCYDGRVYPSDEDDLSAMYGRPIKLSECDIIYAATDREAVWMGDDGEPCSPKWKPSIHMPRWASRITLEIIDVRVERLNDISESDAQAEGIWHCESGYWWWDVKNQKQSYFQHARYAYQGLWDSINGADSHLANPWVWVIEFKVHSQNIDEFLGANGTA